jgi:hypothetical protein
LIVAIFLATAILSTAATEEAYEPLTPEQVRLWIQFAPEEELIAFIIKYDFIEHSLLMIQNVDWAAVVLEDGTVRAWPVYPEGQDYAIAFIGREDVGQLRYGIQFPPLEFPQLVPEKRCETLKWALIIGGAALVIGSGVGLVIGLALN